jgi:hypothetical protein
MPRRPLNVSSRTLVALLRRASGGSGFLPSQGALGNGRSRREADIRGGGGRRSCADSGPTAVTGEWQESTQRDVPRTVTHQIASARVSEQGSRLHVKSDEVHLPSPSPRRSLAPRNVFSPRGLFTSDVNSAVWRLSGRPRNNAGDAAVSLRARLILPQSAPLEPPRAPLGFFAFF